MVTWRYPHLDLDERPFPDGSRVLRPIVRVSPAGQDHFRVGIVDSGLPITVAGPALVRACGVDLELADAVMTLPLRLGGNAADVAVYRVELDLVEPPPGQQRVRWTAQVAVRSPWIYPFAILLGHRGWFDQFPTTIDATHSTVTIDAERLTDD